MEARMKCNYCGKDVNQKDSDARKCPHCGNNPHMKQGSLKQKRLVVVKK
jgi:Zn finger protein HypA/HybF involved in hydrogenase expression